MASHYKCFDCIAFPVFPLVFGELASSIICIPLLRHLNVFIAFTDSAEVTGKTGKTGKVREGLTGQFIAIGCFWPALLGPPGHRQPDYRKAHQTNTPL
jgi:hypothetical protein